MRSITREYHETLRNGFDQFVGKSGGRRPMKETKFFDRVSSEFSDGSLENHDDFYRSNTIFSVLTCVFYRGTCSLSNYAKPMFLTCSV